MKRLFRLVPLCMTGPWLTFGLAQAPPRDKLPVEKTRPLPEVGASDQKSSNYQPAHPFTDLSRGVLSRTIFEAPGPSGYRLEVRDLRVDSGAHSENVSLPGASFLEVQSGAGGLQLSGAKRQELKPGSVASVSQGQTFTLDSAAGQPLILRAYLLRSE